MKKASQRRLLAVVLLIIVVVLGTDVLIDGAIKSRVESAASKRLEVKVSIEDLELSVFGGEIGMVAVKVANPPGYQSTNLLEVGDTDVAVEMGSLLSDVVNVKQITLDNVNLVVEQKGLTNNNLREVLKNLPRKEDDAKPSGKKLHVDNLDITGINVQVKLLGIPSRGDTVPLKVPPIRMEDLGGEEPMTTADLAAKIIIAIAKGVAEEGAGVLPDDVIGGVESSLDDLESIRETITEKGREILDRTTETGEQIKEGIDGILKPKDD